MGAKSNNIMDIIRWINGVTYSCRTQEQLNSAERLITLYADNLKREKSPDKYKYFILFLYKILEIKRKEIKNEN